MQPRPQNEEDKLARQAVEEDSVFVQAVTKLADTREVVASEDIYARGGMKLIGRGTRLSGELYDRLVGFVEDLERVGKNLTQAQDAYTNAHKKLSQNRGNVIRQAEMLRELGVKPTKALPAALVDRAKEESTETLPPA